MLPSPRPCQKYLFCTWYKALVFVLNRAGYLRGRSISSLAVRVTVVVVVSSSQHPEGVQRHGEGEGRGGGRGQRVGGGYLSHASDSHSVLVAVGLRHPNNIGVEAVFRVRAGQSAFRNDGASCCGRHPCVYTPGRLWRARFDIPGGRTLHV